MRHANTQKAIANLKNSIELVQNDAELTPTDYVVISDDFLHVVIIENKRVTVEIYPNLPTVINNLTTAADIVNNFKAIKGYGMGFETRIKWQLMTVEAFAAEFTRKANSTIDSLELLQALEAASK